MDAKLEADIQALEAQRDRLRDEARSVTEQLHRLYDRRERAKLVELVGVDGGVKVRFREGGAHAWMDDLAGKLMVVRRTRGTVDYGARGLWDMRLDDLIAADEPQGHTLSFG